MRVCGDSTDGGTSDSLNPGSIATDHHLRRLDHCQHPLTHLYSQPVGRRAGDDRHQFLTTDVELHFDHDAVTRHTGDFATQLVASAQFDSTLRPFDRVDPDHRFDFGAIEQPLTADSFGWKLAAAGQGLHPFDVELQKLSRVGCTERITLGQLKLQSRAIVEGARKALDEDEGVLLGRTTPPYSVGWASAVA